MTLGSSVLGLTPLSWMCACVTWFCCFLPRVQSKHVVVVASFQLWFGPHWLSVSERAAWGLCHATCASNLMFELRFDSVAMTSKSYIANWDNYHNVGNRAALQCQCWHWEHNTANVRKLCVYGDFCSLINRLKTHSLYFRNALYTTGTEVWVL